MEDYEKQHNHANHSYTLNVQLVMTIQEISWCDTEVEIICSFLNLLDCHATKNAIFQKIENKLVSLIQNITTQLKKKSLFKKIICNSKKMTKEVDMKHETVLEK